jgi:hypothetical protein
MLKSNMSRVFITFAVGDQYEKLSDLLKESVELNSKYNLIIYKSEDFNIEYKPESWKPGYIFIYKVLSCLKALETYDEVVWLDNDCLVTKNIDKIWERKIDNYPLLPKHRFYNFETWPHGKTDYCDSNFLKEGKQKVGLVDSDFNNLYLQACCMFFNKDCESFFKEVLNYYSDYNDVEFPHGDETIINLLIWKNKYSNNLGDVFLCTHYFSPYLIEGFIKSKDSEEYKRLFDISLRTDGVDEDGFILSHGFSLARHNRIGLIENNFDNLLFFHGSKRLDIHNKYLSLMK